MVGVAAGAGDLQRRCDRAGRGADQQRLDARVADRDWASPRDLAGANGHHDGSGSTIDRQRVAVAGIAAVHGQCSAEADGCVRHADRIPTRAGADLDRGLVVKINPLEAVDGDATVIGDSRAIVDRVVGFRGVDGQRPRHRVDHRLQSREADRLGVGTDCVGDAPRSGVGANRVNRCGGRRTGQAQRVAAGTTVVEDVICQQDQIAGPFGDRQRIVPEPAADRQSFHVGGAEVDRQPVHAC